MAAGVLGNAFYLSFYCSRKLTSPKLSPTDAILAQLALTNAVLLLSKGIPEAMFSFRLEHFLGNVGCKFVFYLQRVSRGTSICLTGILSAFQALAVSPHSSRLAPFQSRSPKCVGRSCVQCWLASLLLDLYVPLYITGPRSGNSSLPRGVDLGYCFWEVVFSELAVLPSFRDVSFVACMAFASSYLVLLLYRHQRRTRHIHGSSLRARPSPELKATRTILLLVGTFISAYCVSGSYLLYRVHRAESSAWAEHVLLLMTLSFPASSPFIMMPRQRTKS
ncbi:vomeronasal type-1 receptor 4-like [Gracilinanus agilis]|uniref:vomeronasal type-1 receptor 4-like n=1 Tax=Gracilinanus agilis TaxID=191870 RepID=UPI001CFDA443|nr:vomeronasal type-1 receptor 4-like [Gracilinanus agilis]